MKGAEVAQWPDTEAKYHWNDVDPNLVNESLSKELSCDIGGSHEPDVLVPRSNRCHLKSRTRTTAHEGKRCGRKMF